MTAVFERFTGTRFVKTLPRVQEGCDLVLIPRRDLMLHGAIIDWMRFNRTDEVHEGLPIYLQSDEQIPDDQWLGEGDVPQIARRDGPTALNAS